MAARRDDETEQLRAEIETLRASQTILEATASRFADAFDYAPTGLCTLDAAGTVLEVNLTGTVLLRASRAEVIGRPFARLIGVDPGELRAHLQRCRATGRRTVSDLAIEDGGDDYRALQLASLPVDGRFPTEFSDVSERKRAYELLRFLGEASHRLGASLDEDEIAAIAARLAVPFMAELAAVDILDDSGRWRRGGLEHFEPEITPRFADVTPGFTLLPRVRQAALAALDSGQPQQIADLRRELEHPLVTPERRDLVRGLGLAGCLVVPLVSRVRVVGMLTLLQRDSGRPLGANDLTLASEYGRRVASALEKSLLHGEVVAAGVAKDRFLAMVSHELRTPLAALLMWVRALRDATDLDTRMRALNAIEGAARLQSRLVEDLVDLARSLGGKLSLALGAIDIEEAVVAAVETQRPMAAVRRIRIDVVRVRPCGAVWADPQRLAQIVTNLLSNAVKFSAEGSRIVVTLDCDGDDVILVVRDDGMGITAELLPIVFEPFRQGDELPEPKSAGLGLGLAIVKQLVDLHGGSVAAASAGRGRGAEFTVRLPVLQQKADAQIS